MFVLARFCVYFYFVDLAASSILSAPPQSAVVVAFEDVYDLSLLANTLSDQGIDATLIVPETKINEVYESLIEVEVLKIKVDEIDRSVYREATAIKACESLLRDEEIARKIREIQPTFTVFPAFRHDSCLIPWAKSIESIPVIYIRSPDEQIYVFEYTKAALPIQNTGFWSRLSASFSRRSIFSLARDEYSNYALRLVGKYLPETDLNLENLYLDVRLILWGADTILRSDFALLTQSVVEIGCHHCRGVHPLQEELQKSLIEYRLGTVVILLDDNYEKMIIEMATKLPQGREGLGVVWKKKNWQESSDVDLPANLFVHRTVDRQDLIGYSRSRVVLSHCSDTEFLEAAFHGTPIICFPRNTPEERNSQRALHLGFARTSEEMLDSSSQEVANTINQIHATPEYREAARRVSLAMRDRLNPASDRLIYWLRYLSRTKDETLDFFRSMHPAKTFNEDLQFLIGLLVGCIFGCFLVLACILARYLFLSKRVQRSKGRYAR